VRVKLINTTITITNTGNSASLMAKPLGIEVNATEGIAQSKQKAILYGDFWPLL